MTLIFYSQALADLERFNFTSFSMICGVPLEMRLLLHRCQSKVQDPAIAPKFLKLKIWMNIIQSAGEGPSHLLVHFHLCQLEGVYWAMACLDAEMASC